MPPRARSRPTAPLRAAGLSAADLTALREKLEAGKKPRVVLLVGTALAPAGTSVPVLSLAEPAVGEFVSVRLRDDVVPFSPAELSVPVRGRPATLPLDTPPAREVPISAPQRPYQPTTLQDPPPPARLMAVPAPAELPEVGAHPEAGKPAKGRSGRPARAAGLSLTLRFTGQAWTYESTRGGRRTAAKPLNLAAVRGFADRLDDPALRRDLQLAIDLCRQQAQTRADVLRAELEKVEVELASLDE